MEKPKVGDKVHVGHGSKGGAGVEGIVTKIEGDTVHIRSLKAEISDLTKKPTYKQYKGDIRNVTVESEQIDKISKVDHMSQITEQKHRVGVTVSEPDHPRLSMRKETILKFAHVTAGSNSDAIEKAKKFYKKAGYKIHDAHYVGIVNEDTEQIDEIDLDWQYKNIMQTKGLSDRAKKQTTDIYNKLKKKEQTIPQKKVTEDADRVDEISKDKLRDYKHKAELSEPKDDHEYANRSKGIERADKKLNKGSIVKKPYEQFIKSISEAWPGTPEYEAKFGKPKGLSGTTQGNRHDITVKGNVTRAVRRIDPATGHTAEPKQKVDIQDGPKRGRGRPPGKYGAYARKLKESLEIIESLETDEELDSYVDSLDEDLVDELLAYIEESMQENPGRYKIKVHNATYLGMAEETSMLASHVSRIVDECLKARKGVSEASRGIGNDALGDYEKDEVRQLLKDKAKVQKESNQTGSWRKETPWRKITEPDTTVDKSGAKHTMHSKVRDLARRAMNKNPNVPQKVKESLDVLITMDEQFDLDGYFYELDEDIGSSVLEALEQPLDEGKIITQDSNKSPWPGRKNNYDIIKKYPAASGNTAYVVMQKNGFHGVLVLDKNNNLIRSYINAHNLEKAHAVARHYAAKGDIGMNQVIPGGWTLGGGLESVIDVNESDIHVKEEQLEEMAQGKEYKKSDIEKKIKSGDWEAVTDIKPGKLVELRHHSGKRVQVYVKEEQQLEESISQYASFLTR